MSVYERTSNETTSKECCIVNITTAFVRIMFNKSLHCQEEPLPSSITAFCTHKHILCMYSINNVQEDFELLHLSRLTIITGYSFTSAY